MNIKFLIAYIIVLFLFSGCDDPEYCKMTDCSGHGTCKDNDNGFKCKCDAGYNGKTCGKCADGYHRENDSCFIDESCNGIDCLNGTCIINEGEAECTCDIGYTGDSCDECYNGYAYNKYTNHCDISCGDYPYQVICKNNCIDILFSNENCGGCNLACNENEKCFFGNCQLESTGCNNCNEKYQICCEDGNCLEAENAFMTTDNCGGCGIKCSAGEVCIEGKCYEGDAPGECGNCSSDTVCCADQSDGNPGCVNSFEMFDGTKNCGFCNNVCPNNEKCNFGTCQCNVNSQEFTYCDNECTNILYNENNCGDCGTSCNSDENCLMGKCIKADGNCNDSCSEAEICCFNEQFNESECIYSDEFYWNSYHCGGCGNICPAGTDCYDGECECYDGMYCGDDETCTNIYFDEKHCGACDNNCESNEKCIDGICLTSDNTCGGNCDSDEYLICCNGDCIDGWELLYSDQNCGACGNICPNDNWCENGECICGSGQYCSEEFPCTNIALDEKNCGNCEIECLETQQCINSICVEDGNDCGDGGYGWCGKNIGDGSLCCNKECVSIDEFQSSNQNCGGCGITCEDGSWCVNGQCDNGEIAECYSICSEYDNSMKECMNVQEDNNTNLNMLYPSNNYMALKVLNLKLFHNKIMIINNHININYSVNNKILLVNLKKSQIKKSQLKKIDGFIREYPVFINNGRPVVLTHNFIVRFKEEITSKDILNSYNLKIIRKLFGKNGYVVKLNDEVKNVLKVVEELKLLKEVIYAQPDFLRTYKLRSTDTYYDKQWHLNSTGQEGALPSADVSAEEAWTLVKGDPSVIIAINDDGVDINHPDLKDAIVPGVEVPSNIDNAINNDCCWHGTCVAGVAAAIGYNDIGVRGMCPACSIMPVFTLLALNNDPNILTEDTFIAESFTKPVDLGAAVINNSWGTSGGDPTILDDREYNPLAFLSPVLKEALDYAETNGRGGKGTVVVFAAGNGNELLIHDEFASYETTVAVGATDDQNRLSNYSTFGTKLDVSAPSNGGITKGIVTTDIRDYYGLNEQFTYGDEELPYEYTSQFGGTSSAAPLVSGLIGLIISANPELTAAEIRDILRETADKIDPLNGLYRDGHSIYYGYGKVNAYRAVRAAMEKAENCIPFDQEICNGVDDTCDGVIDEGCELIDTCKACIFNKECKSGACVRTPNDESERCLNLCNDNNCEEGYTCTAGICVPTDGRCDECTEEECNGIDDNCDGVIDENVCSSNSYECHFDAECSNGICLLGMCFSLCTSDNNCDSYSEECNEATFRYGKTDGRKVCSYAKHTCSTQMCDYYDSWMVNEFKECIGTAGDDCAKLWFCLYGAYYN